MIRFFKLLKKATALQKYILLIYVVYLPLTQCDSVETTTPLTPPPHRGAARQMYGSGSLRPPGAKPYGPKFTKPNPTSDTHQNGYRRLEPFSHFPLPISPDDLAAGFPLFPYPLPPQISQASPRNVGGLYGGRIEYSGRRVPMRPPNGRLMEIAKVKGRGYSHGPRQKLSKQQLIMKQDQYDGGNPEYEHICGGDCTRGEFLCTSSCICIKEIYRCDGETDCDKGEDEFECRPVELAKHMKCDDLENGRYTRCPKTGRCILKDWLCDGDDDCGDYTDETHCGAKVNCTVDQFECSNGLCIPRNWVCDNDNDCKDYSDESNCTRSGCTEDEFTCTDSSCISLSWKCDKERDCPDGSDENECELEQFNCNAGEFHCGTSKCIKYEFKCDGDNDCGDWSDEDECPKSQTACLLGEFKCNSGKCIPDKWKCDRQQDCEDNEDENDCDETHIRECSDEEFTCNDGACILKTWVCDGVSDCNSGEDESKCEIICDESKFACPGIGINDTSTEFCINKKHVCDGQKDCPKGDDEKNCPTKKDCEEGSPCAQECIVTHEGKDACTCKPGYYLASDGKNCEDINECLYQTDPVCSQTCNNTIGSFTCGCMTGYILRPDLRSCKALGAPPTLLFANRVDIRQVSLSNQKYTSLLKGLHNAIALDYHYEKKMIFWSDVSIDVIKCSYVNGTGLKDIIRWGLESPGGVALDWIHDLLFWTDSGTRRIEVATLDGKERAIIAANDLDKPRAIAVHPGKALIFWTDWGPSPKIERSYMDGTNRRSIITESVFWPNGLTLDYTTDRIYWADAKHNVIETSLFDGSDRRKVISKGLPHPFALTIFEDAIYWTDWHTKSISTANKATGAGFRTIHANLHFPMDIHSYHSQRQPKYENRCGKNNGGCTHMCLPNTRSFTCVCPMGQKLAHDKKSCLKPEKLLIFARKKDLRIKHLDSNSVHQHEIVVPIDGVKSAVALAWDSKEDSIFWTDVEKDTINKVHWNGSNQMVVVHTNIVSPAGLAFDWITNKLYWTDAGTAHIEVANSDGTQRSLLIWDGLDKPRDIVVDPIGGYMYWSDWGEKPKIERAAMDGSMRSDLIGLNLTWPNGLAIDHENGRLYWADGGTKSIESCNLDGGDRKMVIGDLPHPFGLDIFENTIYWTDWHTSNIESANKVTGANRTVLGTNISGLMDVRIFHRKRKIVKSGCDKNNGGCSHLCLLKPKGFSCACPVGINLKADGKTCMAGPNESLLLAHRYDIRQISLDVPYVIDVVLPFPQLKNVVSVDVDSVTNEVYWADTAECIIDKATFDGKSVETVISNELTRVDAIAIDSSGRKMYWTDGERDSIEVAELDGSNRKVLIWSDLDSPRALTLHYELGLMFWSDWGAHAKIEVAEMDGTNRRSIITENLTWPNGLAIDKPLNRLYWTDGKQKSIESSDLDGQDRRTILIDVPHPYGLVVTVNYMYWTDWKTRSLHRSDKTGSNATVMRSNLEGLMDVRSVRAGEIMENVCGDNNGGCSHLCLRNSKGFSCNCPTGINLVNGSTTTCGHQPENYLLFATRSALARISLDTPELWDVTLPIHNINHIINVDYHWQKQTIYFTDFKNHVIQSVNMKNLSDIKPVIYGNTSAPNGLAVDWLANNIYWTDTQTAMIEVCKTDGSSRKVIVKENLIEPRSLAVFPRVGCLFWTEWGKEPKIERSYLDGTNRQIIVLKDLGFPNGLVIDYIDKRLYWTDSKWDRIESSDLHGRNRIKLMYTKHKDLVIHPFGLALVGDFMYWTDWYQKTLMRADKKTGEHYALVRGNLDGAMGITVVTENRQTGWNPCLVNNGGCTHLCLFKLTNYTCGCPDIPDKTCKITPDEWVTEKNPNGDDDDFKNFGIIPYIGHELDEVIPGVPDNTASTSFYLFTLAPMLGVSVLSIVMLAAAIFYRRSKKKYMYATGRSVMTFSNPNYYTPGGEPTGPAAVLADKRPFLWKRLKYDKSQDRVYEDKGGSTSPEVASLIPTVLTPSGSNCEAVTPELGHSPLVTPLHRESQTTSA